MVTGIAYSVSLFELWGGVSRPSSGQIPIFMTAYSRVMLVAMFLALAGAVICLNRRSHFFSGSASASIQSSEKDNSPLS
jgi:hypothetical protein